MGAISYSVQIMLPSREEAYFVSWARTTPLASWCPWGGHMTLLPQFEYNSYSRLRDTVAEVAAVTPAFLLHLNKVEVESHKPNLAQKVTMLLTDRPENPDTKVMIRLHQRLRESLGDRTILQHELERSFIPHLSLTLGLERQQAEKVAAAAKEANLELRFTVRHICLAEHSQYQTGSAGNGVRLFPFPLK